jgi:hypothetical protein
MKRNRAYDDASHAKVLVLVDVFDSFETHRQLHDKLRDEFSPSESFHVVYFLQNPAPAGQTTPDVAQAEKALAALAAFCKSCGSSFELVEVWPFFFFSSLCLFEIENSLLQSPGTAKEALVDFLQTRQFKSISLGPRKHLAVDWV